MIKMSVSGTRTELKSHCIVFETVVSMGSVCGSQKLNSPRCEQPISVGRSDIFSIFPTEILPNFGSSDLQG